MIFQTPSNNILLVMHKRPDADAFAALNVIKYIVSKSRPTANFYIVSDEELKIPFPKHLQPNIQVIKNDDLPLNSTAFIIDHSRQDASLLKNWKDSSIRHFIIIDHHYYYNELGRQPTLLINEQAYSTCEILYDYLKAEKTIEITKEIALILYIGIFCDSLYFQTPLKSKHIKMLNDLVENYGADIDKHQLYFRGKYFLFKKLISEIIFLHANKLSSSSTVTIWLPLKKIERLRKNYIPITSISAEILTTRAVNHVIIRYETFPKVWNVYVATNNRNLLSAWNTKPQRPNAHYYTNLSEDDAKTLQNNLRKRLQRLEEKAEQLESWEALAEDIWKE